MGTDEVAFHCLAVTMAWRSAVRRNQRWYRMRCPMARRPDSSVDRDELRVQMRLFGGGFVHDFHVELFLDALVAQALRYWCRG